MPGGVAVVQGVGGVEVVQQVCGAGEHAAEGLLCSRHTSAPRSRSARSSSLFAYSRGHREAALGLPGRVGVSTYVEDCEQVLAHSQRICQPPP